MVTRGLALQHLIRDQRKALKFVRQLEAWLDELASNEEWTPARREVFIRVSCFLTEELCRLMRKEAEILYPAVEQFFPERDGPLAVLRGEHEALNGQVRRFCEIGKSLRAGEPSPQALKEFEQAGRQAAQTLDHHFYKEEAVFFPLVGRRLSPELDAELARKMESLARAPVDPSVLGPAD